MSAATAVAVGLAVSAPLGALWAAGAALLAHLHQARLDRYDAALLALANDGRES